MNPKWLAIVIMIFAALSLNAQEQIPATPKAPEQVQMTDTEKTSYSIGAVAGRTYQSYKNMGIEIDMETFIKGLKDSAAGGKLQLSDEELKTILARVQKDIQIKQEETAKKLADENKKKGDAFQSDYKKNGAIILPNSDNLPNLQYKVLKEGDGRKPVEKDMVEVNFKASLINGNEIGSSKSGKPMIFEVGAPPVACWKTILLNMPVGSKWEVVVPPEQAYGIKGSPPVIGPNSTLIFELELLGFNQSQAKPQAPSQTPSQTPN
jgi:FKBP-type peptidyl-prolyl cis-trans isomerase